MASWNIFHSRRQKEASPTQVTFIGSVPAESEQAALALAQDKWGTPGKAFQYTSARNERDTDEYRAACKRLGRGE